MNPSLSGTMRPLSMSKAFVPLSMMSIFVMTPTVRTPSGSDSLAIYNESDEIAMMKGEMVDEREVHLESI